MLTWGCVCNCEKIWGAPGTSNDRSLTYWMFTTSGGVWAWPAGCGGVVVSDITVSPCIARSGDDARAGAPGSTDRALAPSRWREPEGDLSGSPGDLLGRRRGRVAAQPLAVHHAVAGQRQNKAPVTHHDGIGPIRQCCHFGTEQRGPVDDRSGRLLDRRPPHFIQGRKVMFRPGALEFGPRRADVAGERIALADDRIDHDHRTERLCEGCGSFEGTRIRRGNDAGNPFAG